MRRRLTLLTGIASLLLAAACSRCSQSIGQPLPVPVASQPGEPSSTRRDIDSTRAVEPTAGDSFAEAIRDADFAAAKNAILALGAEEQQKPIVRYALARVLIELTEFASAEPLLRNLELELPVLGDSIRAQRARAEIQFGPYGNAADFFSNRGDVQSLCQAAWGYAKAGDLTRQAEVLRRALELARRADKQRKARDDLNETAVRMTQARIAELQQNAKLERAELRWVALNDPTSEHAVLAETRLSLIEPRVDFSRSERLQRARRFSDAGQVARFEAEIAALGELPKPELSKLRAFALFNARRYEEASQRFEECAQTSIAVREECVFFAARATSRAHNDQQALLKYSAALRAFPGSPLAADARRRVARLYAILGEWDKAFEAYTRLLKKGPRASKTKKAHFPDFRYERAVVALAGAKDQLAASEFAALAAAARDAREKARLTELWGVSLMRLSPEQAIEKFQTTRTLWPLSFPALLAEARLRQLKVEVTPAPAPPAALPAPVVHLPERVALLASIGFDEEAATELSRVQPELMKQYAPRGGELLCGLYGKLHSAAAAYMLGQRIVRGEAMLRFPTAESRWAWDCLYPRPHLGAVTRAATRHGVAEQLIYALMRQESAFEPTATSPVGALGLLQLMPNTAARVAAEAGHSTGAEQLKVPGHNVELGVSYFRTLLTMFAGHFPPAIAAYNAGPHAVGHWLEHSEALPLDLWVARIPFAETRAYVTRVMTHYVRYNYLAGQELPTVSLELPRGVIVPDDAF